MPRKIGYARVSTAEQNLDLQISALKTAGCELIFKDHGVSGCRTDRPELEKALEALNAGDTLIIWRLDRMSRSLKHLIEINETLNEREAFFESLTEKIDTSVPMGEFVFHILGAVAQLEREIGRERTMAGLSVAAENGNYPGRPRVLSAERVHRAYGAYHIGESSLRDIALGFDVSTETLRRRFKEIHEAQQTAA